MIDVEVIFLLSCCNCYCNVFNKFNVLMNWKNVIKQLKKKKQNKLLMSGFKPTCNNDRIHVHRHICKYEWMYSMALVLHPYFSASQHVTIVRRNIKMNQINIAPDAIIYFINWWFISFQCLIVYNFTITLDID